MAKTHRRRAGRLARQAAAAAARATAWTSRRAAATLLTNHDWKQMTKALDGVLCVESPGPFTDLELLCPDQVWLVVDLPYVCFNGNASTSCRQRAIRAVDALVKLCIQAETLRPWDDLYRAFWTRVFVSDMSQSQCNGNETWVNEAIRFMKAKGTHIAFQWQARRVTADVIDPIRRFLEATTGAEEPRHVPIQTALRFEGCHLTMQELKHIHELLKFPITDDKLLLCDLTSLKELSLRHNALYPNHLETVIALLKDPTTPRIDGLFLDNTVPDDANLPDTYAATYQRALTTALGVKITRTHDHGVRLSLAECKHLDSRLVQAIETALIHAARPLRALSLASIEPPGFGAMMRLTRLIQTPFPTATSDFELNVSYLNGDRNQDEVEEALLLSLAEMVTEAIPRIYATATTPDVYATCRLLVPQIFEDQFLNVPVSAEVSTTEYYRIAFVTHNGFFQLVLPDADSNGRPVFGWVSSTAIAGVRIGDVDVVGSSCRRLVLEASSTGAQGFSSARFIMATIAVTGAHLTHLSLRNHLDIYNILPTYLARSPRLIELNAENGGPRYLAAAWKQATPETGALLQVLNIANCRLDAKSLENLPLLPNLRYLNIGKNTLMADSIEIVLSRLQSSRALECVNVHSTELPDEQDEKDYGAVKTRVQKYLEDEYITLRARAAFLSVVPIVEAVHDLPQCVPRDAIASIFQMIGTRATRVVVW